MTDSNGAFAEATDLATFVFFSNEDMEATRNSVTVYMNEIYEVSQRYGLNSREERIDLAVEGMRRAGERHLEASCQELRTALENMPRL